MPKQKCSIGLPKNLSRDDAYIQGVFDGEEGYMQVPKQKKLKVKKYEVTCVVEVVFCIESYSAEEASSEVVEYLWDLLPQDIEEEKIKVLDMWPHHSCTKRVK
jgi:hypothetical protein